MEYGIGDIFRLLGSLGLFLYGMKAMSDALMEVAGDRMRKILSTLTANRFFAVFTGFLITAAIQSSSATTLMVVSFVNASLLTLTEAVGVIMGAHIGTTVTAWLITILGFKVSMSAIALPLVALGFLMIFSKKHGVKHWGQFIIGFAILFIGLQFLKDSIPDLHKNPEMLEFLKGYTDMGYGSVFLFLLIGTVITMIIQSSSATMALTLVMCHEGWIPFDIAAAMVLGENIGTTITANLAAIVANFEAKRAARAHFITQVLGVSVALIFFYPFLHGIGWMAVKMGAQSPFETAASIPISLSLFHSLFNILSVCLLIWFIPIIVKIVTRMVPEVIDEQKSLESPVYLTPASMAYPQTGIKALLDETKRLYENIIYSVIVHGLNAHRSDVESGKKLKSIVEKAEPAIELDIDAIYYNKIKVIYSKIVEYATDLQSKFTLDPQKIDLIRKILIANRRMVDVVKGMKALHRNVTVYSKSENPYMRIEYNALRKMILKVIREINLLGDLADDQELTAHLEKLEKLRNKAKKSDVLISGTIDRLIRENAITDAMASSLMNDSAHAIEICMNLTAHAELLYGRRDTILENVPVEKFMLEEEEPL